MIIRNKVVYVYDIEVFKNVFHCTVRNTETNQLYLFEISERKNQLDELVDFFYTVKTDYTLGKIYTTETQFNIDKLFCGYNNLHYDNPIINYIIDNYQTMKQLGFRRVCESIFNLSKVITTSSEDDISAWKKWKYMICFESFDLLTMLYSNKLRVSLKEMQVTMMYKNVQEFVTDWDVDLQLNEIDSMIKYNINDVNSTTELLNRCKKDIDLRLAIEDEYGVRVLSKDGVNIGMKILTQKYLEKTGLTWFDIKNLRSPMSAIPLKDVILPFIKYDNPILQKVLEDMKKQVVSPGRKGYENKFIFAGLQYSVGVGGIHSVNKPECIIPKEDELLLDVDVASLYPSMLIEYKFYPKHLGKEFLEVYSKIKDERIEAKHNGNKVKNETLKLALNGLSGNLQNEHNFCYSPFAVMQIRINGQLLLLMLAEKLVSIGCRIIQANTDGLFIIVKKDNYNNFKSICSDWEKLTHLVLEEDRFKAMYQLAINDYFAITEDNKVKEKGAFITEVKLGKGLTPKIIPKAVIAYFKDNIPIEETVKNCKDIKDFLMSEKTGKQWHVEYLNKEQQRINRFYASTNGAYLWKWKDTEKGRSYQNMLVDSGVTLLNEFNDIPIEQRNINYKYYIFEAYKLVRELKPLQLSLW
ncbi:hypothetical protein [Intestinibacter sp.]|uniref:hypothetical protein n=1 Tax=Intestinibacter sp. TaxID=1965304 RepID=UPI003F15D34D